jgi:exodeoxyribonuclease-3
LRFKIATFNVNSIRPRVPILLEWLGQQQPEVLCVQETKVEDRDFPAAAFEEVGYRSSYFGQKAWNGVAILSRRPLDEVSRGLLPGGAAEEARLIRAVCSGVVIINAYVPQGRGVDDPNFAYKIAWLEALRRLLATEYSPGQPLLVCGDLNHAPAAIDVHDPEGLKGHVCYHPDVDSVFRKLLAWGLADLFRRHCPEPGQYSFYDYRVPNAVKRGVGWRIDHILVTPSLAGRSLACHIDLEPRLKPRPSDHTPVVAEFDLP